MSQGQYIICPKCNSAKVELVLMGTKTKFNWGYFISSNTSFTNLTKKVREQKRHCMNCGYLW